jgi:16S rRNA (guanine966-N2)-methyltransferase
VRVIGGSSRGRRLPARLPAAVRPTSDRVREAIFDILGSMGGVPGLTVADLFCGSGALGAEALSRGAAAVTFVDQDPEVLSAVRANLTAVGLADLADQPATVVRGELPGWLGRAPRFDLALCDPPYAFDDWETLLTSLQADVAVLESSVPFDVPDGWMVARSRRYGGTLVTVASATSRQSPAHPPTPATTLS